MIETAKKILVVDDQAEVANQIGAYLGHFGFNPIVVNSVEAALVVFDSKAHILVISDVLMPGKNGFDMVQFIKNEHPQIPIALISGYFDAQMREYQRILCIEKIYQKPVFLKTIKQILNDTLQTALA
jgi:two-component system, NtrC family, response regulator PilR